MAEPEQTALYQGASLVLFPSLYEGFGMIPFEAATLGTACAYTHLASMRELLPSSGALPSLDVEEAGAFVSRLLDDDAARARIVAEIAEAARTLTWERTAKGYLEVYERALSREPRSVSRLLLSLAPKGPQVSARESLVLEVYRRRRGFRLAVDAVIDVGLVARRAMRESLGDREPPVARAAGRARPAFAFAATAVALPGVVRGTVRDRARRGGGALCRPGARARLLAQPVLRRRLVSRRHGSATQPFLSDFEQNVTERTPNRWLDPATLVAAGVPAAQVIEHLAAARVQFGDPRTLTPTALGIRRLWRGRRSSEKAARVVVLAHFDAPGLVAPAFVELLEAFIAAGRHVVVCSTSIDEGDGLEALRTRAAAVCAVPNTGHDWGAYQAGLRYVLEELEPASVLLANDSVSSCPTDSGRSSTGSTGSGSISAEPPTVSR